MIVTGVVAARAIWLFDINDVNSHGRYLYDELFPWLVDRYHFAKVPANPLDMVENAWEFLAGRYVNRTNIPLEVKLRVYNDGIVADTRSSTEDSDAFLEDLLTAAVLEMGLTFTETTVYRKMYASELNLVFEKRLDSLHPRMQQLSRALSDLVGTACEPTSLAFAGDGGAAQTLFRFERKTGLPFSENRYWSLASLTTSDHLKLLEQLEALLTNGTET